MEQLKMFETPDMKTVRKSQKIILMEARAARLRKRSAEMEQLKMFETPDMKTVEMVIRHIERNYIDQPQGRLLRVAAENIVEDLREWAR